MAPRVSFWLLLIAIIHCGNVFPTANAEKAFVRPNTTVMCPSSSQPCLTFNEYAQEVNQYFVDNTTFLFLPGTHELDIRLELENLSNISLIPSDEVNTLNDTVQILLSQLVNITWTNCDNVEVSGLTFILSGQITILSNVTFLFSAELIFQKTTGFLTNLTLMGSGTRWFVMCIFSHVQIGNLVATGIQAPVLYASYSAINFYGQSVFYDNNITVMDTGYTMLYFIGSHCNFSGNTTLINNTGVIVSSFSDSENSIYGSVNGTFSSAMNFTGGISIITISGNASFVNNTAPTSGSLIQLMYGTTCYIPGNVSFLQNSVNALVKEYRITYYDNIGSAAILVYDSSTLFISGIASFVRNRGVNSGAIQVFGGSMTFEESSNVSFIENTAILGGAISIQYSNLTTYGRVLFERNSAHETGGAIAITSNPGQAIINCSGTMHLVQNSARQGGAMAFSGTNSTLILTEPLTANFVENSATISGGAIFIDDDTFVSQLCSSATATFLVDRQGCFIKLSSRVNIRLNFDNNTADIAGRIFYGGNLDKCKFYVGGELFYNDNLLNTIASISNVNMNFNNFKDDTTSNVSSDPLQVCICRNDSLICDNEIKASIIRGSEFTLQAVVVGQGKGAVPSAVRISLDNSVQLSSPVQRIQNTGKTCMNISYRLFAESSATVITLFPDNGPCRDFGIGRTQISVTFLPCPNGFVQNVAECVCDERLQNFNASCNVDDSSIEWTSNVFWMGALYDNDSNESTYEGLILHPGCPLDYCVATPVPITLDNLDIQCDHNHSGILCGSCKENYSIAFGTLHCLPCSNNYLALILPFGLAGIALVAIVLFLRLTVTAGTLNSLVFYANVIQANRSIFFPGEVINILTVFIAWLNLDLGIETCFYDGMTTYVYTWLQFVFPFYVWFLIGLIIVATHYSSKLTKLFGKNPVATLSTLLLISYSKILRTIISSLSFTTLEVPDGNNIVVWLYDGSVGYTGNSSYLVLAVFSTLILLFLFIPYTLLLFCAHWLQALSHWRILSWLNKIKPFMDTYHAPYKKQTRYWTGLLLFVRLFLFAFDAINSDSELILIITTSVTAVLAALAYVHKGIYENHFNGILEAFFIANLCFFAAVTYHIKTSCAAGVSQDRVAHIFVGLAFAAFICIILFHIYMILRETALWKKIPKFSNVKKYFLHGKEENNNTIPDDCQQSFNLIAPTTTIVELREPLLEQ